MQEEINFLKMLLWLGGGGSFIVTIIWGYMIWKMSAFWKKDDEKLKKEVIDIVNNATSRLDLDIKRNEDDINKLQDEDKLLHERISSNKEIIINKLDHEIQLVTSALMKSNERINKSLQEVIAKLGKIEGKLEK